MVQPPKPASGQGAFTEQEQFLTIATREEAIARFDAAFDARPLGMETVALDAAPGRILAADLAAPIDTPPFDRSVVDGFALRAADAAGASEGSPVVLALNPEALACGTAPRLAVTPGTATPIATGAPIPRGADCVVMIEHSEPAGTTEIAIRRAPAPGQNIAFAGSDIARGQLLLHGGTRIGAREIGMIAAIGLAAIPVFRRPRVAVISTGDELVAPGAPLRPAAIHDSNGPVIAAALAENGCIAVRHGAIPDDPARLEAAIRAAHADCDAVILSGGSSKGAGDLTYRLVAELGAPGIIVHGVALKPGKPLCLALADGKPVIVLPGFPTSAMFTFHDIVAPVLRRMAGLPPRAETRVSARVPVRLASELGRDEFVMVALTRDPDGLVAHPVGKGSGAVTAFAQADGFLRIPALADSLPAGSAAEITLFNRDATPPDLTIIGSHCAGLDAVAAELARAGLAARILAIGSLGGLAALRRGECDIAPIHLLDPATGRYNHHLIDASLRLIPGWRRMQGLVFRPDDPRFSGKSVEAALAAALADPQCLMVNRNPGAGTRVLIDSLIGSARPPGHSNQPRAHHAVAAAIAQGRADWGVAIEPVARALGLGFLPIAEEHYDFAVAAAPRAPAMLDAFERALADAAPALAALGFRRG